MVTVGDNFRPYSSSHGADDTVGLGTPRSMEAYIGHGAWPEESGALGCSQSGFLAMASHLGQEESGALSCFQFSSSTSSHQGLAEDSFRRCFRFVPLLHFLLLCSPHREHKRIVGAELAENEALVCWKSAFSVSPPPLLCYLQSEEEHFLQEEESRGTRYDERSLSTPVERPYCPSLISLLLLLTHPAQGRIHNSQHGPSGAVHGEFGLRWEGGSISSCHD